MFEVVKVFSCKAAGKGNEETNPKASRVVWKREMGGEECTPACHGSTLRDISSPARSRPLRNKPEDSRQVNRNVRPNARLEDRDHTSRLKRLVMAFVEGRKCQRLTYLRMA